MLLREMVSEDSGYWDYALLMFYDEMMHSLVLSGLTALTDFGWAERAALIASGALNLKEGQNLENTVRGLAQAFLSFGRNLTLVCVFVGAFVLPDTFLALFSILKFYKGA
jgi:hypothetical protein